MIRRPTLVTRTDTLCPYTTPLRGCSDLAPRRCETGQHQTSGSDARHRGAAIGVREPSPHDVPPKRSSCPLWRSSQTSSTVRATPLRSAGFVGNVPTWTLCPAVVPGRCSVRFWPQDLWRRFSTFVSYRGEDRRAAASGAGTTRNSAIIPALVVNALLIGTEIRRASCRESVCTYVEIMGDGVGLQKKK